MSDWQLIQAYTEDRSEAAFTELVERHLNWVYSAALRQVGNAHLAEDVAQSVFILLARKAKDLRPGTLLNGWLFRTTCFVAARALRSEQRRHHREEAALTMTCTTCAHPEDPDRVWEQLTPHLDQAVAALSDMDRHAILLRYYEKQPMREVGQRLGINEEAAKKRVSRAVDKLREFLAGRGVTLGSAALAAMLGENTVRVAEAALASSIVKTAITSSASMAVLPHLARETLSAWRWARIRLAASFAAMVATGFFLVVNLVLSRTVSSPVPVLLSVEVAKATIPTMTAAEPQSRKAGMAKESKACTGVVLDEHDQPIQEAKVWAGFGFSPSAEGTSDESGGFVLDKVAGLKPITVMAEGYAADQLEADLGSLAAPLQFHLKPIQPLRLRVVDENGRGIEGAEVALQHWWGRNGSLNFRHRVDAQGRFTWRSAPKGELEFCALKTGYKFSRENKFEAGDQEHTLVLHPAPTILGAVTDRQTGLPVPQFKVIFGYWRKETSFETRPVLEHTREEPGRNGLYTLILDEEHHVIIRIEAEGYEMAEAAPQWTSALDGTCDFQLQPIETNRFIRGTVLLPNGRPAAGVEVALCTIQCGVMLEGCAFQKGLVGHGLGRAEDYRQRTDAQGAFSFEPKPGAHTVAAIAAAGLGQARCLDYQGPIQIRLEPWGKIQGTVRTEDGKWADRKVVWVAPRLLTSWMTMFHVHGRVTARSDANGSFTMENVPPGDCDLAIEDGPGRATVCVAPARVPAGQTLSVQVGGAGLAVTGKLVPPLGVEIRNWANQAQSPELTADPNDLPQPKGWTPEATQRWHLEFPDTEAGRACLRNWHSYTLQIQADGSFIIPEVLPGRYWLHVGVSEGWLGAGSTTTSDHDTRQIASYANYFVVPDTATHTGSPMDLGELKLTAFR